jgi:superfamily I DNA/RNA helicase
VVEGETAGTEADPRVARLKAGRDMVAAIERAVRFYEDPPTTDTMVPTDWVDVRVTPGDWSEAFDSATGVPHNEAHGPILDELVSIVTDRLDEDIPVDRVAKSLRANKNLHQLLTAAWPMIDATDLVGDLWTVPAYLRWCAPQLTPEQVQRLQRSDPAAWTESDLPLLDAARQRLGVRDAAGRERRRTAAQDAAQQQMSTVIKDLIATDDSELQVMSMLRGEDLRDALVDPDAHREPDRDRLAGPFAHIVVDEAQELTDAQWQMLLLRCPSRSFTIVGDRAQARHGFGESWSERLQRVGFERIDIATLSINYRTPAEVMEQAAQVIRAALPDANVPTSVRSTGIPVEHRPRAELRALIKAWRSLHDDGIACVISADGTAEDWFRPDSRLRWLTPELAKGLEFDLVVLVDPDSFGAGIEGAVDRYVAMTRATDRLVILTG